MTPLFRKFLGMNWVLFLTMLGLLIFGVFAIYSACWMREAEGLSDKWREQIVWIVIGLFFYFSASLIDYKWVLWAGIPFYAFGIVLLVITDIAGVEINSHRGWLAVGGKTIQTSQVAIAGGIVFVALILSHLHRIHRFFAQGGSVRQPCRFFLLPACFQAGHIWKVGLTDHAGIWQFL